MPECCIQYSTLACYNSGKQSFSHSAIHYWYTNSINTTFSAELQILFIIPTLFIWLSVLTVLSHLHFCQVPDPIRLTVVPSDKSHNSVVPVYYESRKVLEILGALQYWVIFPSRHSIICSQPNSNESKRKGKKEKKRNEHRKNLTDFQPEYLKSVRFSYVIEINYSLNIESNVSKLLPNTKQICLQSA